MSASRCQKEKTKIPRARDGHRCRAPEFKRRRSARRLGVPLSLSLNDPPIIWTCEDAMPDAGSVLSIGGGRGFAVSYRIVATDFFLDSAKAPEQNTDCRLWLTGGSRTRADGTKRQEA